MNWPPGAALPQDERAFREKLWHEIVRKEDETQDGMPQLRAQAFIDVALLRARALEPFVPCHGLDAAAIHRLKRDSLVVTKPNDADQVAPAQVALQ